jgi:drug/metabolite transporter (DMT)-like permease|tara:strand:+ start:54572 stop:55453 length:882 start_codon:yes stop_codon:yes gene_type:complete
VPGDYRKGFWLTLGGVLAFTPDALLIRLTAVDAFTLAFGRGLLAGTVILTAYIFFVPGGFLNALRKLGWWGFGFAGLQAGASLSFYASFSFTSVANVLVIFACTPLIAAVFSRFLFGETVSRATQIAIVCVAAGLIIVASGSFEGAQWVGDALAMVNAVILGLSFAIIRGRRQHNMIPATALGLFTAALVAVFFAEFPPMQALQWGWLVLGGAVLLPVALALITVGPRYLPAPEAAMLGLLESVLGPFWVWLVIGENPGIRSIVGGAIVITVLFVHAMGRFREEHQEMKAGNC